MQDNQSTQEIRQCPVCGNALEIDGDEFNTFVCTKSDFEKLADLAKRIGHRIDLVQNL